jgi:ABC-type Fe3+-hydroxamate transport system substrate-binding protein
VRVVSLVPSVTETLASWGVDPVACTRFCERDDLVHVGGTKDPDTDAVAAIRPDLVVVDAEENRREDHDALVEAGLAVHVLHVRSLDDVGPALAGLAERVGVPWSAPELPPPVPVSRRAFVPIWRRPWMALGLPTYGGSLLARLGVGTVFAEDGPYPTTTLEEAAARHPDLVLAPSEPYPFTRRQLPELDTVGPTVFVDGKDLFWWGARTPGALARLASVLAEAGVDVGPGAGRDTDRDA